MGGSFIKRSSISKLFRIVFSEEVIELFSIFIVISFFILFLTVKPEFSNLITFNIFDVELFLFSYSSIRFRDDPSSQI